MHQQFNIQQLYVLHTLYLCVLYLSENKQRLVPLTMLTDWFRCGSTKIDLHFQGLHNEVIETTAF